MEVGLSHLAVSFVDCELHGLPTDIDRVSRVCYDVLRDRPSVRSSDQRNHFQTGDVGGLWFIIRLVDLKTDSKSDIV